MNERRINGDVMNSLKIALIGLVTLFLICGAGSAATIATSSVSIEGASNSQTLPLVVDSLPDGLAGYNIVAEISPENIAQISSVSIPEWAGLKEVNGTPGYLVKIMGVDLMDSIVPGAVNTELCTLTIEGIADGTATISFTINEMTDDSGNAIDVSINPATVIVSGGSPIIDPNVTPTKIPTVQPTETPTVVPTDIPNVTPTKIPTVQPTVIPTGEPTPVPQVDANFTATPVLGHVPMTVFFTDISDGYPEKFVWDFGDNMTDNSSVIQNPQHTYKIPGNYTVTLMASNSEHSDFCVKENLITVDAMKQPARGEKNNVTIYSVPSGAEVYLNNAFQGYTPTVISDLSVKDYQLRLHLDGYFDVVDPIIINGGSLPSYISGYNLQPHKPTFGTFVSTPPQTGAAYIVSVPDSADVYIDDELVGKSDIMIMNLEVGSHNLTLVKDGFSNWTDTLDIKNELGIISTYYYEGPYYPRNNTVEYKSI